MTSVESIKFIIPCSVLFYQRLKAAVHYTVACLCEEVAEDKATQFSKQAIAAISEITFRQCGMTHILCISIFVSRSNRHFLKIQNWN
uniref:Centromere protein S n=1 Tax=Varanus komodoensis TaxID=61221 RepID=A0A8D2LC50_VARKO